MILVTLVTLSPPLFYPIRSEYHAPFNLINNQKILDPVWAALSAALLYSDTTKRWILVSYFNKYFAKHFGFFDYLNDPYQFPESFPKLTSILV